MSAHGALLGIGAQPYVIIDGFLGRRACLSAQHEMSGLRRKMASGEVGEGVEGGSLRPKTRSDVVVCEWN